MKHYFYVGIYEVTTKNDPELIAASRFSGIIEVGKQEKPGPVYAAIIKEWSEMVSEVVDEDTQTYKIYLEKMEQIS